MDRVERRATPTSDTVQPDEEPEVDVPEAEASPEPVADASTDSPSDPPDEGPDDQGSDASGCGCILVA